MKTPKHQTREYLLAQKIASFQDMLAEGAPVWERDRDARCHREIQAASAELVALAVKKYRSHMAAVNKRCEQYRAEKKA